MPSPFPGMDPFLEHPDIFPDLHDRLVNHTSEALQARLPEPYIARLSSRVWVEISHRFIGPDVNVLRTNGVQPGGTSGAGGVAVAVATRTRPLIVKVPHDERREINIEIYKRLETGKRLVTTIEMLSPTNKTPGEHGRDLYKRKQREILNSKVHLVEIDLLRGGEHTTAVPSDWLLAEAGPFDYHVCIHRFDNLEDYFIYPIKLPERLPEIAIPLLPGDADVPLDLQAVFERSYAAGRYEREVQYEESGLVPGLSAEQSAWAKSVFQAKVKKQ